MAFFYLVPFLFFLSSCAALGGPALQPEISGLVTSGQIRLAADKIEAAQADYGQGNYLLYYLDRGLVEYYAGLHSQSILSFEKAKERFKGLYAQSVSKEALSWVANDYALPYRGADYEYVLVNVFQSMNYLATGDVNEALVEARDLSSKYQVIDQAARAAKRRRFEDNGFARMFMGLVHEASPRMDDRVEARLFYREAKALYSQYYDGQYEPALLRQRLSLPESGEVSNGKAVVVVFQIVGFSPVKVQEDVVVPVDGEFVTRLALPKFVKRYFRIRQGIVAAESPLGGRVEALTELGISIEELAARDLESRKAVALAKALARPALKYVIERKQKENIGKKFGRPAADIFGLFSSLYNIYSERADLRSWQALPAEIRVARLELDPGRYALRLRHLSQDGAVVEVSDFGEADFAAGQVYFFVSRANR